jgi:hypothetical protein
MTASSATQPSPGREPRLVPSDDRDHRAGPLGPKSCSRKGVDVEAMSAVMVRWQIVVDVVRRQTFASSASPRD